MISSHTPAMLSPKLLLSCLTASLAMFVFGYHLGELTALSELFTNCSLENYNTAPRILLLPACIKMSTLEYSFASAIWALTGGIGALFAGPLCDRIGRKRTMLLLNVFNLLAPLLMFFATDYTTIIFGRLFAGIGSGAATVVVPMYIAEISPNQLRGALGNFSGVALAGGIAIASLFGYFLSTPPYWRIIVGFSAIISIIQVLGLLLVAVESPVYLLSRGEQGIAEAHAVSRLLGSLKEIPVSTASQSNLLAPKNTTLKEFLTSPLHRRSLQVLLLVHAGQQLSGINVYFSYAFPILISVFGNANTASMFFVIISFYDMLTVFISGFFVDRLGRRPMLLTSIMGMIIAPAIFTIGDQTGVKWLCLVAFIFAVTSFSTALSNVPFILTAEVVESHTIGVASQVALAVNSLCNFIVLFGFLSLFKIAGSCMFLFFVAYMSATLIVGYYIIPETKGRSASDVVTELRRKTLNRDVPLKVGVLSGPLHE